MSRVSRPIAVIFRFGSKPNAESLDNNYDRLEILRKLNITEVNGQIAIKVGEKSEDSTNTTYGPFL